jgi:hypothetical protein
MSRPFSAGRLSNSLADQADAPAPDTSSPGADAQAKVCFRDAPQRAGPRAVWRRAASAAAFELRLIVRPSQVPAEPTATIASAGPRSHPTQSDINVRLAIDHGQKKGGRDGIFRNMQRIARNGRRTAKRARLSALKQMEPTWQASLFHPALAMPSGMFPQSRSRPLRRLACQSHTPTSPILKLHPLLPCCTLCSNPSTSPCLGQHRRSIPSWSRFFGHRKSTVQQTSVRSAVATF